MFIDMINAYLQLGSDAMKLMIRTTRGGARDTTLADL